MLSIVSAIDVTIQCNLVFQRTLIGLIKLLSSTIRHSCKIIYKMQAANLMHFLNQLKGALLCLEVLRGHCLTLMDYDP